MNLPESRSIAPRPVYERQSWRRAAMFLPDWQLREPNEAEKRDAIAVLRDAPSWPDDIVTDALVLEATRIVDECGR